MTHNHKAATIQRFEVLYSKDLTKKQKRWSDGTLKHYSFNSAVVLYNSDQSVISSSHIIKLEEEIEFGGYVIQVGALQESENSKIEEIMKNTSESKTEASKRVKKWATEYDSQDSIATTGESPASAYKGFQIAPPPSYRAAKAREAEKGAKLAKKAIKIWDEKKPGGSRPSPYSRPDSKSALAKTNTTPFKSNTPISVVQPTIQNLKSTPSKGIGSPFKPPSFNRPQSPSSKSRAQPHQNVDSSSTLNKIASASTAKELEEEWEQFAANR